MTAVLISLTELKRFIPNTPSGDDTLLQEILDSVEETFLRDCSRRERPFSASQNAITEVHDGTGSSVLTLKYPISSIAGTVKLGRDTTDLDEELTASDVDEIVYAAGKRSVERTDGGIFGDAGSPRYVRVTYDALADLPDSPKLAMKRMCERIYRQRGAADVTRESLDGYTRELAADDKDWKKAVEGQRAPRI